MGNNNRKAWRTDHLYSVYICGACYFFAVDVFLCLCQSWSIMEFSGKYTFRFTVDSISCGVLWIYWLFAIFLREVHEEASQAREKASELKMRRQEQAAARREKLKQAYLRKQFEKLKASKAEQTWDRGNDLLFWSQYELVIAKLLSGVSVTWNVYNQIRALFVLAYLSLPTELLYHI